MSKLNFAITGATGLVGTRLCALLREQGHTAYGLRRAGGTSTANQPTWNVQTGEISTPQAVDAVIHLAGRNVGVRWSAKVKREAWDSRIPATEKLAAFLAQLPPGRRPKVLIVASAVGIYGNRGDEVLTEDSPLPEKGQSFLSDICVGWEGAARQAEDAGIRVVKVRVGVVLGAESGALGRMAVPVKWCVGGPIGPGTQWMAWISNTDICRLLLAAAQDDATRGVINGVGPAPVRQLELVRTLGKVLHRPTVFPLPGFMVKLVFGQMGVEVLLASMRVVATKLPAGFAYQHATLEAAMRSELGK